MTEEATLQTALADVRRAYRLLWCYQERLFDVVKTITGEFSDLRFYGWHSQNGGRFDQGTNPLGRGAWFAFPQMNVSHLYKSGDNPNRLMKGDWMLDIYIASDSGYDAAYNASGSTDPTEFPGVEESRSLLNLYAYCCTDDLPGNWLTHVWHATDWPEPDGKPVPSPDVPVTRIGRSFDIAELPDKDSVLRAVNALKQDLSAIRGANIAE